MNAAVPYYKAKIYRKLTLGTPSLHILFCSRYQQLKGIGAGAVCTYACPCS